MSMISPDAYAMMLKDDPYEELLSVRDELMEDILYFEAHRDEPEEPRIEPSAEVRYQCDLDYLAEVCKLIAKKYNEKFV